MELTTELLSTSLSTILAGTRNRITCRNNVFSIKILYKYRIIVNMEIENNILNIIHVDKSKYVERTSDLMHKIILFAKNIPCISKIFISGDESKIYFQTNGKDKPYINLYQINLLSYGLTWYNRLGFGVQNPEWLSFIKRPLFDFLRNINFVDINSDILSKYETASIEEAFKDIILTLKSFGDDIYDKKELMYVYFINNLLEYIMQQDEDENNEKEPFYEKDGKEYLICKYVPDILSYDDVEYVL